MACFISRGSSSKWDFFLGLGESEDWGGGGCCWGIVGGGREKGVDV